jgi:AhpD family alkylhydroperoxidase
MIRYVPIVRPETATGATREIYAQIEEAFGRVVSPFVAHSGTPAIFAEFWSWTRQTQFVGTEPRALKEAVAAVVSRINACRFCLDAHSVMLHACNHPQDAALIAAAREAGVSDPGWRDILVWAAATRTPDHPLVAAPPFSLEERPEIVATAIRFHYVNRIATILLDPSPLPPLFRSGPLRGFAMKLGARQFTAALARPQRAPEPVSDEAPDSLRWAAGAPHIAIAFARFRAVVEEVGAEAVGDAVRARVTERVARWQGEDMPLGRSWVDADVAGSGDKPAARLALLTALAPHQVDGSTVGAFVESRDDGRQQLLALLSWASLTAAQRVASWLTASLVSRSTPATAGLTSG